MRRLLGKVEDGRLGRAIAGLVTRQLVVSRVVRREKETVAEVFSVGARGERVYGCGITVTGRRGWCSCSDYRERGVFCKHIAALALHEIGEAARARSEQRELGVLVHQLAVPFPLFLVVLRDKKEVPGRLTARQGQRFKPLILPGSAGPCPGRGRLPDLAPVAWRCRPGQVRQTAPAFGSCACLAPPVPGRAAGRPLTGMALRVFWLAVVSRGRGCPLRPQVQPNTGRGCGLGYAPGSCRAGGGGKASGPGLALWPGLCGSASTSGRGDGPGVLAALWPGSWVCQNAGAG